MAKNPKNKFPADRTGSKYSEFKNTKRVAPGKVKAASAKSSGDDSAQASNSSN